MPPPIFRKTLAFALSVAIALPLFTTGGVTNENAVYAADEKFTYGDVNNDGIINILDMISLKSYLVENNASNFSVKAADVDDDGTISSKDVVEVSMYLLDQVGTFSYERNIDTDKDGLCDYIEKEFLQTDPAKADTDGDGLSDYDEVYLCDTDPLTVDTGKTGVKDSAKDSDNDKLTNAEEIKLGTSPTISDTDSDGLNDYDEVKKYKTDPLKSDTDGDMISDSAELKLGLDPLKVMTDGKTSDTDRVFEQKIASDSNILSAVNTEENPFLFSADAKCSGYIEESAYACVSGYSNYLSSDVILGNIVDFSYDDAFSIEELSLSFKLDDSYTAEDYMIFNYSEDINMLFPVETEYNGNVLSATATNGGTYCVVDLDKWTDSLSDADITQPSSTPAPPSYGFVGSSETKSYSDLEIYFMLFVKSGYTDCTRQSVAKASRSIIDYCNQNNKNIKIYFVTYIGNTVASKDTGKNYVSNSSTDAEINDMLGRSGTVPISYDSSSNKNALTNIIKKELLGITGENANSQKYCFMIDGNTEPKCDSYIQAVEDMKLNGTTFDIICNDDNGNIAFYNSLSSNGSHYKLVTDISDIIVSEVFSDEDRILSYNINTGIGNEIPYDLSIIKPEWKEVFEKYPDELSLEDIQEMNFPDIDGDGIPDCLEINMEYINFVSFGKVVLPTYSQLAQKEYSAGLISLNEYVLKKNRDINNIKVMPLLSDPSRVDSDGDGFVDHYDVGSREYARYAGSDPNPLKSDVKLIQLKNDFFSVNYEKSSDNEEFNWANRNNGSYKSYGGYQGWFGTYGYTSDNKIFCGGTQTGAEIYNDGCGIIALGDMLLYMAIEDPKYNPTPCTASSSRVELGNDYNNINFNTYIDYIRDLSDNFKYIPIIGGTGGTGVGDCNLKKGLVKMAEKNNMGFSDISWQAYGKNNFLDKMTEMISNNIPVVYSYNVLFDFETTMMYWMDNETKAFIDYSNVKSHFMVATGIIYFSDDVYKLTGHKTLIQTASYGKRTYIDFDDYKNQISIDTNLLYIRK